MSCHLTRHQHILGARVLRRYTERFFYVLVLPELMEI